MAATGLLDRSIGFLDALRGAGLPVSMAESLDAVRAIGAVDLLDREELRTAFAATTVKRPAHRLAFGTLFDLWWPPVIGDGGALVGNADSDGASDDDGSEEDGQLRGRDELRAALMRLLL